MIDYRFHLVQETYVVWVADINRYLQLKEPAFYIFEQWVKGVDKEVIGRECARRYSLSDEESARFVSEIIGKFQALFDAREAEPGIPPPAEDLPGELPYFSQHTYLLGSHLFRFIYRDSYLQDLFHPLFRHHETGDGSSAFTSFELFSEGGWDAFRMNDAASRFFPLADIEFFQGAIYMEILNVLHGKSDEDWMGVIHASAVTDGRSALIFTAAPGGGKSSLALLMMACGFGILSDDFVPLALHGPEIYHFPAGISVKSGAIPLLKEYVPQSIPFDQGSDSEDEVFVPIAWEDDILPAVPARAIVFVHYDPDASFDLRRESNLEVMNSFIRQAWITPTPEAAERFLDWYFALPVYSLHYSDNNRAMEAMKQLLIVNG